MIKYLMILVLLLGNFVISTSSVPAIIEHGYIIDLNTKTAVITAKRISQSDIELLAHLIESEAGNQSMLGRIAVGNVILNRSKINNQTIKEIIFHRDKRGNPQFDGIDTKHFKRTPSIKSYKAAREAFHNQVLPEDIYYFYNPRSSTDSKWIKYISKFKWKDIGDHRFCHYNK